MEIVPVNKDSWGEALQAMKSSNIFLDSHWLDVFGEDVQRWKVEDKSGTIALFATYKNSIKGLSVLSAPPFAPHIALQVETGVTQQGKDLKVKKDLSKCLSDFAESRPEKIKWFALPPEWKDMQAFQWSGFKVSPKYTYRIDLSNSLEDIKSAMDSKTRSLVNKEEILEIVSSGYESAIINTIKHTQEKSGSGQDMDLMTDLVHGMLAAEKGSLFGVLENGQITAGAFFVHDNQSMYYLLGGGRRELSHPAASSVLIWKGIELAKERGLQVFDFEGSMIPQIERFFRGFGGEITPYYSVSDAPALLKPILRLKWNNF